MEPDKVVIIVRNSSGQFFVHQRSATKKIFPLFFGLGAGGHVEPQEKDNPEKAALRELQEELSIVATVKKLFSMDFRSEAITHTLHIFEILWDGQIMPCGEFEWSGWLDEIEVDRLASENELCPDTKAIYERYRTTS